MHDGLQHEFHRFILKGPGFHYHLGRSCQTTQSSEGPGFLYQSSRLSRQKLLTYVITVPY